MSRELSNSSIPTTDEIRAQWEDHMHVITRSEPFESFLNTMISMAEESGDHPLFPEEFDCHLCTIPIDCEFAFGPMAYPLGTCQSRSTIKDITGNLDEN